MSSKQGRRVGDMRARPAFSPVLRDQKLQMRELGLGIAVGASPIGKATTRLIGIDDTALYLGGPELAALDLKTRSLRWTAPVPGGCYDGR